MIASEIENYRDQHAVFQRGSSPDWLANLRHRGMDAFTRLGIPTRRLEDWRFTNVSPLAERPYELASLATRGGGVVDKDVDPMITRAALDEDYHRLVFVNGVYSDQRSRVHSLPGGVFIDTLRRMTRECPDRVQDQLTGGLDFTDSAFAALNTGFLEDGAFIDIPDATVLDRPVHLIFIATGEGHFQTHPRNVIRLGAHSTACVVETYLGDGDAYFTNAITQVTLAENAELDCYKLQHEHLGSLHIAQTKAVQRANSRYRSHYFSFGASLARNELDCELVGEHTETTLNGLYMPTGSQLADCRTRVDHAKPNCNSHELYKGILQDRARGVFNGKIFVRKDAQKTDAKQSNQAMLLSDDAVIDTKPQLEIYADDVRCTHGATIGELDEHAFNYLRSRGIGSNLARKILVFAFANEVVQGVELPAVRRQLESVLLSGHDVPDDITLPFEEN